MNRFVLLLCFLAFGAVFWFFPLFRIVCLDELRAVEQEDAFDAAEFAEVFWNERLMTALDGAADAAVVLKALRENPQPARETFGRKIGIGRSRLFVLRGAGAIVSVDNKGIGLVFDRGGSEPDVVLRTGLLFGNTARDATGLLRADDFPHSQEFNEISTEINRIIEARVIRGLKERAEVGRQVHFVGCAEVPDDVSDPQPLAVIPYKADVQ